MATMPDHHWSEPLNPLNSVRNPKQHEFSFADWWQFTCTVRSVGAGAVSAAAGLCLGLFFQNYDNLTIKDDAPLRQQLRESARFAWQGAKPLARNFGYFGLWYSAFECMAEQARGKADVYNHVIAGCATGAGLAWQGGPSMMAASCLTIAAFSVATEAYFHRDE